MRIHKELAKKVVQGKAWIITPTEKEAKVLRTKIFEASGETVWIGNQVMSLGLFLRKVCKDPPNVLPHPFCEWIISDILSKTELKNFPQESGNLEIPRLFARSILALKTHGIPPEDVTPLPLPLRDFKNQTSREADLRHIYEVYEEYKTSKDWIDEGDLYLHANFAAIERDYEIWLAGFHEIPAALSLKYRRLEIDKERVEANPPVEILSLPTPFQERIKITSEIQNLIHQGATPHRIGILCVPGEAAYEPLLRILVQSGLMPDFPSPFLPLRATDFGIFLLKLARKLNVGSDTSPIPLWCERLARLLEQGPWRESPEFSLVWQNFCEILFYGSQILAPQVTQTEFLRWMENGLGLLSPELPEPTRIRGVDATGPTWIDTSMTIYPEVDFLFVPQFLDGIFPRYPRPQHFFSEPGALQTVAGKNRKGLRAVFPEPRTVIQRQAETLSHAVRCAGQKVTITFPRLDSTGEETTSSPFLGILQGPRVAGAPVAEPRVLGLQRPLWLDDCTPEDFENFKMRISIEQERRRDDYQNRPYHALLPSPPRLPALFSPSSLEIYGVCPFQFYSRYILGIPPKKEFAPELDPEDQGSLFHEVLEKVLRTHGRLYRRAIIDAALREKLWKNLREVTDQVFLENSSTLSYAHPHLYAQVKGRVFHLVRRLLEKDLEISQGLPEPMLPTYFEWSFGETPETSFQIEIPGGDPISLCGRIDRIDSSAGKLPSSAKGKFLIVDYKTGTRSAKESQKKQIALGLALQLPIYLLAARKFLFPQAKPVGGFLLSPRDPDHKKGFVLREFNKVHFQLHPSSGALSTDEELKEILNQTQENIRQYVSAMRKGIFHAKPKDPHRSCGLCDYREICRYANKPND